MNGAVATGAPARGRELAAVAGLLADASRAAFCLALIDGRAWTMTELARYAGVAPSTASHHLDLLVDAGVLVHERQGRHRYVRLAGPEVAEIVEALTALAPRGPAPSGSLTVVRRRDALARARTCYDHLAGDLGVAVTDAMAERGLLTWDGGLALTPAGASWLDEAGIAVPRRTRRPAVRACLDWTVRRHHLAGAVGAALCRHAFDAGWIVRVAPTRAVRLTDTGRAALSRHLDLTNPLGPPDSAAA